MPVEKALTEFQNSPFAESTFLIPSSIEVVLLVYAACTAIELLRISLIEKHYIGSVDRLAKYFDKKKERFFSLSL